jgi:beta-1,4-N-acetylglucosaminyltransferase
VHASASNAPLPNKAIARAFDFFQLVDEEDTEAREERRVKIGAIAHATKETKETRNDAKRGSAIDRSAVLIVIDCSLVLCISSQKMTQNSGFFLIVIVVLFLRTVRVALSSPSSQKLKRESDGAKLLVVIGSGGHTAEMVHILRSFLSDEKKTKKRDYFSNVFPKREYIFAVSDTTSVAKIERFEREEVQGGTNGEYRNHFVPRAREVGQSYFTSVFTTLLAFWHSWRVYWKTKPDAILTNGPGTCVPVILACFLGKVFGYNSACKVMYVESVARTRRMSLSGRLCYGLRLADVVFVMWPELKEKYPRSRYCGRIY